MIVFIRYDYYFKSKYMPNLKRLNLKLFKTQLFTTPILMILSLFNAFTRTWETLKQNNNFTNEK